MRSPPPFSLRTQMGIKPMVLPRLGSVSMIGRRTSIPRGTFLSIQRRIQGFSSSFTGGGRGGAVEGTSIPEEGGRAE